MTTPNAIGIYNTFAMFRESERVVCAPIPDPTMGFGHIHLWTPALLAETAAWAGFEQRSVSFYHGREAEKFARDTTNFKYPKHYFLMKAIKWIADRRPSRRGFFVASFQPSATR